MTLCLWLFIVIIAIIVFAVIVVKQEAKKVALMISDTAAYRGISPALVSVVRFL